MTPRRQPVQPEVFGVGIDPDGVMRQVGHERAEAWTKVPYTSSVRMMRSGRLVFTSLTSLPIDLGRTATDGGLLGIDEEERLDLGVLQFVDLGVA